MKLPNKLYDVLKWVLTLVIPALISLITGLGILYHFETEIITGTIALIATFVGAVFGISNVNYKKAQEGGSENG